MFTEETIFSFTTRMEKFRMKPQEHTENPGLAGYKRIVLIRLLELQNDTFQLQIKSSFFDAQSISGTKQRMYP